MNSPSKVFILMGLLLATSACSDRTDSLYKSGKASVSSGDHDKAIEKFEMLIKRDPRNPVAVEAAKEGAKSALFESKEYLKALEFNHFIVLYSNSEKERLEAQQQAAQISFEHLQNYKAAISEYSKYLSLKIDEASRENALLNVAKSYYYLTQYKQALIEIEHLVGLSKDSTMIFHANSLKANILIAQKQFLAAIELLKNLIANNPELAKKETLGLTLAVCYEENFDYKNAIKTLEELKEFYQPPEFIELRIKKLKERLKNAPGAKGMKK